jgi:hypothetical protein
MAAMAPAAASYSISSRHRLLQLALLLLALAATVAAAFVPPSPERAARAARAGTGPLHAKKPAAKKGSSKSGGGGPSTAKVFGAMGSSGSSSSSKSEAAAAEPALMRDRATLALREWVRKHGGKVDNLGVATVGSGIRGVVALKVSKCSGMHVCVYREQWADVTHDQYIYINKQPFKKGEALISIPYELALDVTPSASGGMTSKLVGGWPVGRDG